LLKSPSISTVPDQLSIPEIKGYLYHCKSKEGLSVSHINQTISALKLLHKDVCGLSWDGPGKVKRPSREKRLPVILSQNEARRLVEALPNLKHQAILSLLYSSGLRREELLCLETRDIDTERMVIRVRKGKGNKGRDTLLSPKALGLLRQYWRYAHPKPSKYLFEGPKAGEPYSAASLAKIVKKAALVAGIKKPVSPHSLRHAFATHLLEQGVNLKVIQRLMGHSSLRSTMCYLHLASFEATSVTSPYDDGQGL